MVSEIHQQCCFGVAGKKTDTQCELLVFGQMGEIVYGLTDVVARGFGGDVAADVGIGSEAGEETKESGGVEDLEEDKGDGDGESKSNSKRTTEGGGGEEEKGR